MIPTGLPLLLSFLAWLPIPDARQIRWQRSVEDALALARLENRPILVAVNMDGESASERIVRERYRDPEFVAATRSAVCLVSSVFRHTPRDHDEEGRRIACPRLGEVTCGEHAALEPALYDRWLGGERIAPRHAWIEADGTKSFDLFLLFDLRELDQEILAAAKRAPPASERGGTSAEFGVLAGAREHRQRLAFEERLAAIDDESQALAALAAIRAHGDAGSSEALRVMLARSDRFSDVFLESFAETARALGVEAAAAALVHERVRGLGRHPAATGLGPEGRLLPLLALEDPVPAATRSLVLGYLACGDARDREAALATLARMLARAARDEQAVPVTGAEPLDATPALAGIEAALEREGAAVDLRELLQASEQVAARAPEPKAVLRPAEELEREMEMLEHAIDVSPADARLSARYGRAALELAQVRMEEGGPGAELLLEDAGRFLAIAIAAGGEDPLLLDLHLARARSSFLLARFEDQEQAGLEALRIAARHGGDQSPPLREEGSRGSGTDALAWRRSELEARRWIGDAAGRLLGARSGGDPAVEAAGARRAVSNLLQVAVDSQSDETDWQSLASVFGALGMRREELACAQAGALRLPASALLRQTLNGALWNGGRIDLAPAKAEWIASRHPGDAASVWFAGYAHLLAAEELRREEEPDRAIEAYRAAERRFEQSETLEPSFAPTADHYRALAALGRGFAHLLADRRAEAAGCLVEGIAIVPAVATARDGLDRDALDLLDGALEWRESGPSPVDSSALLEALLAADPQNAFWARSVADTGLREALRADGRGTELVEREVQRDGRTVRLELPLPTAEGDRYLEASIRAARRAPEIEDTPENRRPLAQSATVFAERLLERGEVAAARPLLREAAELLGRRVPEENAGLETLRQVAADLRSELGEARPIARPGR